MTSTLRVDTAALRVEASKIARARTNISRVKSVASDIAGVVGHDQLASRVRDFGTKWDVTRKKLDENLSFLQQACTTIADTLDELDAELATSAKEATSAEGGAQ